MAAVLAVGVALVSALALALGWGDGGGDRLGDGAGAGGPLETVRVTAAPGATAVPAGGSWALTAPAGTSAEGALVAATASPHGLPSLASSPDSAATAAADGSPTTGGGTQVAGPSDTVRTTAERTATVAPGSGSSLITSPAGTVAE